MNIDDWEYHDRMEREEQYKREQECPRHEEDPNVPGHRVFICSFHGFDYRWHCRHCGMLIID